MKLYKTKEAAKIINVNEKTLLKYGKKYLPNKKIENGKPTYWHEEELKIIADRIFPFPKFAYKEKAGDFPIPVSTAITKFTSTKELAETLNVHKDTIVSAVKDLTLNGVLRQVRKNSQGGYLFTEEQATLIKLKLRERNNLKDNSVVLQIGNDLEFFALIKKREEEQKFLDAYRDRRIAELQSEKENLQIQLDESKEWYSVKRIQKLNPDVCIHWRMLKRESERLGFETKKVFDQNYGEVNAYHRAVYESLYFDSLEF